MFRRFVPKKGHYTLAQDYVEKDRALDFFYSFTDLEEEWGGFVTYMSEEVGDINHMPICGCHRARSGC